MGAELVAPLVTALASGAFLLASTAKALAWVRWTQFASEVASASRSPEVLVRWGVPLAEAATAFALLAAPPIGLTLAAIELAGFAVGAHFLRTALQGRSCACFGSLMPSTVGRRLVVRNALLASMAGGAALVVWTAAQDTPATAGYATVILAAAPAVGVALARARRRDDAARLEVRGRVLVFLTPSCAPCLRLAADMEAWPRALGDAEVNFVVGGSDPVAAGVMVARLGSRARPDAGDFERWDVPATPWGIAVGAGVRRKEAGLLSRVHDVERLAAAAAGPLHPRGITRRDATVAALKGAAALVLMPAVDAAARSARSIRRRAASGGLCQPHLLDGRDPNIFRGESCEAFKRYVGRTGTTDVGGGSHAKALGWTSQQIYPGSLTIAPLREPGGKLYCNCTGQTYDDIESCQAACRPTLACFVGICQPTNSDCLHASVSGGVAYTTCISTVRWRPPKRLSGACRAERDALEDRVAAHEEGHAAVVRDIVSKANSATRFREYRACGPNAQDDITRAALADQNALVDAVRQQIRRAQEAYHVKHGRETRWLDCDKCP